MSSYTTHYYVSCYTFSILGNMCYSHSTTLSVLMQYQSEPTLVTTYMHLCHNIIKYWRYIICLLIIYIIFVYIFIYYLAFTRNYCLFLNQDRSPLCNTVPLYQVYFYSGIIPRITSMFDPAERSISGALIGANVELS